MTRARALLFLGLVCSATFLWLALRSIELGALRQAFDRLDAWWAIPFVASLFGFCWLKAARWSILLEPVARSTTLQLFPSVIIGYAGTTLMPMQLGEVARAYVAGRELKTRFATVLATIALERVLDVFVLLCVLGMALSLGTPVGSALRDAGVLLTVAGTLLLATLSLYALSPRTVIDIAMVLCRPLPEKLRHRIAEQLEAVSYGLKILRRPKRFLALILASGMQWLFMLGCCWIALQALGLKVPHVAALLVLVTTLLGMSLPAGPGYVGTIQLAFWVALSVFGVSAEDSAAASIFYHTLLCVPLLLTGAVFLLRMQISVAQLRQSAVLGSGALSDSVDTVPRQP